MYVCMCVCAYVCMCVCVYVYVCVSRPLDLSLSPPPLSPSLFFLPLCVLFWFFILMPCFPQYTEPKAKLKATADDEVVVIDA